MDHPLIALFREHAVVVMVALFVGVLYWAFRGRMRARRRDRDRH
ncbi:MAG: hypothetical protein VW338_16200 [Rhodospirillaceae bacterium]